MSDEMPQGAKCRGRLALTQSKTASPAERFGPPHPLHVRSAGFRACVG